MALEEEQIKQAMDHYADFQNKKELLKANKQILINSVIPIEVQEKLNDIDEEFKGKEELIDLEEKNARKVLDMMIEQFVQSQVLTDKPIKLKSELATVSMTKGDIVWDAKSLDAFAIAGHSEILSFRTEEKPKIRVTRNKI